MLLKIIDLSIFKFKLFFKLNLTKKMLIKKMLILKSSSSISLTTQHIIY